MRSRAGPQKKKRRWALAAGFFLCHLLFEVLNEALVTLPRVPPAITLWNVAAQFACCALLPCLFERRKRRPDPDATAAPPPLRTWLSYVAIAAMVFTANGLSQHATHYVDFTLKIVAKSSKLLPTMLLSGVCGNSAAYGVPDYVAGFLLCAGTALFSYGSGRSSSASNAAGGAWAVFGAAALGVSCAFDGLVPNAQQHVMRSGVSSATLMARTNLVGALGGVASVVVAGDASRVAEFARESPRVVALVMGIGLSLAGSVACYTALIESTGSVFTVGVGTLRKSTSILVSFLMFPGKSLDGRRVAGLALVAAGVLIAERRAAKRGRGRGPKDKPC